MECLIPKSPTNFALNILIHITILFCFLSAFFILYVSNVEKQAFDSELEANIGPNMQAAFSKLDPKAKSAFTTIARYLPFDSLIKLYDRPSDVVTNNNQWLFRVIVIINVALVILIIASVIIVTYSCERCVPLKDILIENAIIFSFVGLIEYMFFTHVAVKYIPIKPSTMITAFINDLKKYA
jgi:hypothetical protein